MKKTEPRSEIEDFGAYPAAIFEFSKFEMFDIWLILRSDFETLYKIAYTSGKPLCWRQNTAFMVQTIDWECEFYEFSDFLKFMNFLRILKMAMNFKNKIRHCEKLQMW